MDATKAELLPNELWLQIFSYLENADVLYAFNLLNKRFQQILTPYFYDIDLSEVSLKQFNFFLKDILSSEQYPSMCSFTLKNSGQFNQLFYDQNPSVLRKNILHVQTLQLTIDHWIHEYDLRKTLLPQLSYMPNLTNLHLNILFGCFMAIFHDIFKNLPSTLTHLTILGLWEQGYYGYCNMEWLQLPSHIKSFTFSIHNLETIYKTHFLQTTNNNVEELKLSSNDFDHFKDEYSVLQFPMSLITLHLELPLIKFETLKNLLKLFTNQLKSLILITTATSMTTFSLKNELKSMIKDIFPLLERFKYTIYSPNRTITNNYPAPLPFRDILRSDFEERNNNDYFYREENRLLFDITVLNLRIQHDFSKINLLKLHKVVYPLSSRPYNLNHNISFLNNLFLTSPNLKCLTLNGSLFDKNKSQTIIEISFYKKYYNTTM